MAKNPYPGINPHLNSFLQHKTGWKGFHTLHLADITRALEKSLPPGYYTSTEESTQIGIYDPEGSERVHKPVRTQADILVHQIGTAPSSLITAPAAVIETDESTLVVDLNEILEEEEEILSAVIYYAEAGEFPGKPVTRIELLSPANKFPGSHAAAYRVKRMQTLLSELRLVEIDYLHERSPVLKRLPDYTQQHKSAYPYHIIISDPRPAYHRAVVRRFGVLDKIPEIEIPLEGTDTVTVDLNAVYQQTYEASSLFQMLGAPDKEPVNFEAYPENDREKIRAFMQTIRQTAS